jgi:hypothetical protein
LLDQRAASIIATNEWRRDVGSDEVFGNHSQPIQSFPEDKKKNLIKLLKDYGIDKIS